MTILERISMGFVLLLCVAFGLPAVAQDAIQADPVAASQIQASFEHFGAGEYELSLQAANEALKLNPNSAIANNNICCAQIHLGAYDEAIAACSRALEIAPSYRLAYGNLGWAYEEAAKNAPSAEVYLGLSVMRYWSGDLDSSLAASRMVLDLEPDNALAYNNICSAHALREEWDPAIEACEKALTLDPELQRARNNLRWAQSGKESG
jgi:tetratricopeptide (TPR) repeat protein